MYLVLLQPQYPGFASEPRMTKKNFVGRYDSFFTNDPLKAFHFKKDDPNAIIFKLDNLTEIVDFHLELTEVPKELS